MSSEKNKQSNADLTSTEVSNLWSAFLKNSMEIRFYEYFMETTADSEIINVVEKMLNHTRKSIENVKDLLLMGNISIPLGITEQDVNLKAQKFFSDTFTLFFCLDLTLFSISTLSRALADCTRNDVRIHFHMNLEFYISNQKEVNELMLARGIYLRPPTIAVDSVVDFVGANYLGGILGGLRPVNVAEIANLARIIHRAQFSKMVFVAFSKIATIDHISKHFLKGRDEIQRVLDSLQEVLEQENIPISSLGDYQIFEVEEPPFSDRLMLLFINLCLGIFCFNLVSEAMTSCFRSDIVLKFTKIKMNMMKYYGEGLKLMIKEGWLERLPQSKNK